MVFGLARTFPASPYFRLTFTSLASYCTPINEDHRLMKSLLAQKGLEEYVPWFESRYGDMVSFLRCNEEDLEKIDANREIKDQIAALIRQTKENWDQVGGAVSIIDNTDYYSRKLWDMSKMPSENLTKIEKPPQNPIILCHGIGGSKPLVPYFYSIVEDYEEAGCKASRWAIEPYSRIERRALSLKKQIDGYLAKNPSISKINLIGHSMGGLDCRYYITKLGGFRYTSSLTTIGTPHLGSPWANVLVKALDFQQYCPLDDYYFEGYKNLTKEYLEQEFNPAVPDHKDVNYYSVVCSTSSMSPLDALYLPFLYLYSLEGENDGLVSASSQKWGKVIATSNLSHVQQHFSNEARQMFREIGNILAKEGH